MLRTELESFLVRDVGDAERKSRLYAEAVRGLADVRLLADAVIGAALIAEDADSYDAALASVEQEVSRLFGSDDPSRVKAREKLTATTQRWLGSGTPDEHRCFHWALELPEVRRNGGFDAVVGNPPFQGGSRISAALGPNYRRYLAEHIAMRITDRADLVGFFVVRAVDLLNDRGMTGLLATKTIAEGVSRTAILQPLLERVRLVRAWRSVPWPGGAAVLISELWLSRRPWLGSIVLNDETVDNIGSSLTEQKSSGGEPARLQASVGAAALGTKTAGMGFIMEWEEGERLIRDDPAMTDVIRPFLSGKDIMSEVGSRPTRYAVYFRDWELEAAERYPAALAIVEARVKPDRDLLPDSKRRMRERWWQFEHHAADLMRQLEADDCYLVLPRVAKYLVATRLAGPLLPNEKVVCFRDASDWTYGIVLSGIHEVWSLAHGGRLETRPVYDPSRCWQTLVLPGASSSIEQAARSLHAARVEATGVLGEGLTKLYNRLHSPSETSAEIERLRVLQVELDHAVRDAYGWRDLEMDHGYHSTDAGTRFTMPPPVRQIVLDRLLELNHERYAEEVKQGLHGKKKPAKRNTSTAVGAMSLEGVDG